MRKTSIAAYEELRDSGDLSKLRWAVYRYIFHHGPLTQNEMDVKLTRKKQDFISSGYHARFSELKAMGLIEEIGKRTSSSTGKQGIVWDVTGASKALPIPKKPTRKQLEEKIQRLERTIKNIKEGKCA